MSLKIRTKIKDIQQRQKSPSYISAIDNSIQPATHSSEIFCLHNKNSQFFSQFQFLFTFKTPIALTNPKHYKILFQT